MFLIFFGCLPSFYPKLLAFRCMDNIINSVEIAFAGVKIIIKELTNITCENRVPLKADRGVRDAAFFYYSS